jgi:uncharacterized protein YaeQ
MHPLDEVLPGYKKISEAPNFEHFINLANDDEQRLDALMQRESELRYKAFDNNTKCVFLIQNQGALISYQMYKKMKACVVAPPKNLGPITQLTKFDPKRKEVTQKIGLNYGWQGE